nr:hypothetical protein CFP56_24100 [Quercus suber]
MSLDHEADRVEETGFAFMNDATSVTAAELSLQQSFECGAKLTSRTCRARAIECKKICIIGSRSRSSGVVVAAGCHGLHFARLLPHATKACSCLLRHVRSAIKSAHQMTGSWMFPLYFFRGQHRDLGDKIRFDDDPEPSCH